MNKYIFCVLWCFNSIVFHVLTELPLLTLRGLQCFLTYLPEELWPSQSSLFLWTYRRFLQSRTFNRWRNQILQLYETRTKRLTNVFRFEQSWHFNQTIAISIITAFVTYFTNLSLSFKFTNLVFSRSFVGMGPRTLSIIARCSLLSWVYKKEW